MFKKVLQWRRYRNDREEHKSVQFHLISINEMEIKIITRFSAQLLTVLEL